MSANLLFTSGPLSGLPGPLWQVLDNNPGDK